MKLDVCVYYPNNDTLHIEVLKAFAEGVAKSGDSCTLIELGEYRVSDAAVVFGVHKKALPYSQLRGQVIARQALAGKHTVVIDSGYINRDRYFAAGWDGLNGRADFCNHFDNPDRFGELDVTVKPWISPPAGRHVIVCGQVPWDASVQHTDHIEWCNDTIAWLHQLTDRPVIFRPHPMVRDKVDYRVGGCEVSLRPLEVDLAGAHAVVTFNSNAAVEAVLAGVPVFVADRGAMALDVALTDLRAIESPLYAARDSWAWRLAYTQWRRDEMSSGAAWHHLRRKIDP